MSASRRRWRRVANDLGWPGAVGAALLVAAAALAWGWRPALVQSQQWLLRQHLSGLDPASAAPSSVPPRDPRDTLREGWPAATRAGDSLARLMALGERSGRGIAGIRQFQLEAPRRESLPPALLRVRVGMQFDAAYADVRALLTEVLDTLPNAALDTVALERRDPHDPALHCRLVWSLYFREAAP